MLSASVCWRHLAYEIGTDNTGLANAGSAARAQGPSTIASNPAGMSYLQGTQITGGLQVLYGDLTFDRDAGTNVPGSGNGNALDPIPGGSFFISHELDDHWSVGFGQYGDFGLAVNYDNDWSGRYFAQNSSLLGLSLMPSVAYRFNEQLLWNFGVTYESSAVSDHNRTVTVPMGEAWRIATGATYAQNKDTDVNVIWVMAWLGDQPVDQTKSTSGNRISGQFDNAWLQATTGNMLPSYWSHKAHEHVSMNNHSHSSNAKPAITAFGPTHELLTSPI